MKKDRRRVQNCKYCGERVILLWRPKPDGGAAKHGVRAVAFTPSMTEFHQCRGKSVKISIEQHKRDQKRRQKQGHRLTSALSIDNKDGTVR